MTVEKFIPKNDVSHNSYIDSGMRTVDLQVPSGIIPIINLNDDEGREIEDTGVMPIGAGFGTRGTREHFTGKFRELGMINLLLTKKCNFRCDYCVEDKDLPNDYMWDYTNFEKLVSWIRAQDRKEGSGKVCLSFFGGEPLLEWDTIKEFMRHGLDKHGDLIEFNISTNIVLLDDKKLKWLEENTSGREITFLLSLDGFERVYSRHVTKDKTNNLMHIIRANIENMRDNYPRLFKCSSFRVSLLPEYMHIIEEDLMEMVDYGPENIIVHPVTTEPNAPWTEEMYEELTNIINRICNYAIETSNVEIECMEGINKKNHNCGAGHTMLAVNPDGDIFSCYFTAHASMTDDKLGNFLHDEVNIERGNIYQLNPNYDPKCSSCDKKYCFQCSVKNLLHHGHHFCSSMWCKELADLYTNTLDMCTLTKINRHISPNKGLTMKELIEEIDCKVHDMTKLVHSLLMDKPFEAANDCHCHNVQGTRQEALELIEDMSTLKLALEALHNKRFPNNTVSSL